MWRNMGKNRDADWNWLKLGLDQRYFDYKRGGIVVKITAYIGQFENLLENVPFCLNYVSSYFCVYKSLSGRSHP